MIRIRNAAAVAAVTAAMGLGAAPATATTHAATVDRVVIYTGDNVSTPVGPP
jgi:hypothetical protein